MKRPMIVTMLSIELEKARDDKEKAGIRIDKDYLIQMIDYIKYLESKIKPEEVTINE